MNEIWKKVPLVKFEDAYQVSSLGRVKRTITNGNTYAGRILSKRLDKKGYPHVYLFYRGNKQNIKIHRLVALAFIPNAKKFLEVNHIDGHKQNNSINNLEWVNTYENNHHAKVYKLKASGEKNGRSKLTINEVIEIRQLYKPKKRGYGARVLSRRFGVSYQCISDIINNITWSHIIKLENKTLHNMQRQ